MNKLIEISELDAPVIWPQAEEYLRESIPEVEIRSLQGRVLSGMSTLWKVEIEDGTAVAWASSSLYTNGVDCIAQIDVATTKELEPLLDKLDEFELWAKSKGAHYIEVLCRLGWTRKLKPYGYMHNYTSVIKEVYTETH